MSQFFFQKSVKKSKPFETNCIQRNQSSYFTCLSLHYLISFDSLNWQYNDHFPFKGCYTTILLMLNLSWSFFLFNFFFLSLFKQQRVCGYLFNLNECLQIHALLLHLITMVCLFKQQAKSYHVIIFEGIIRILCIHKNYTGFEKSWPTNMNITNPKTLFLQVQHSILFYIISEY